MKTREQISEDHDHPDQQNYDPYSIGGKLLRAMLTPATTRHEELRAKWAPRIFDPRTMRHNETKER